MKSFTNSRFFQTALAAVLAVTLAAPALAQNKKKDKKDQSEQAQKAIQKQKDIAKGLADKAAAKPATPQEQLDALKAQLQAEKDRHAAALEKLNADLKAATDAGQGQKARTAQNTIDKENEQYTKKAADLQKQIDAAQAKVTPPKTPTPPAPPKAPK